MTKCFLFAVLRKQVGELRFKSLSKTSQCKNCIHYVYVNVTIHHAFSLHLSAKNTASGAAIFPPDLESDFHSEFAVFRTCATDIRWLEPRLLEGGREVRFGSITLALQSRALIGAKARVKMCSFLLGGDDRG